MKKIFELIGLFSLICFSFFYTDKITTVIKENDDILNQIEEVTNQYKIDPINAKIDNNTIIPGINGMEIDINESYKKMKKINSFNTNLLVYRQIEPEISIKKIYNKYIIGGNSNKNEVSLLFKVNENDNVNDIILILKKYQLYATFYIDGIWFENNNDKIMDLIKSGYLIGNLGYNYQYNVSGISWMNTIVTNIGKQNHTYCYTEQENPEILNICQNNKSYTVIPSIIIKKNPLIEVKKYLKNGSIISLDINNQVTKELPLIIEYIMSKDIAIVDLEQLLDESF